MHHVLQQRHASSAAGCIIKARLCQGVVRRIGARTGDGSAKLEPGEGAFWQDPAGTAGGWRTPVLCPRGDAAALSFVLHTPVGTGQRADHT